MTNDEEALNTVDTKGKGQDDLAEAAVTRGTYIIAELNRYTRPRLDKIQLYRDLYAGKVRRKFRQPFNVVLPVFSGILDTLMASFNDDLSLEFQEQNPADYMRVRKLNALWDMESTSMAPNAKFALKTRQDRSNAMFSGRGFMMNYAESDPEYRNCFEVYELEDAVFQPRGGGQLQNHLYNGRQNIIRSESDLKSGVYDQKQVAKLLALADQTDYFPEDDTDMRAALGKFQAMGLDVKQANYVGERLFKLVEMRITMKGEPFYLTFSPWYKTWVRFDRFSQVCSADLDPWISWATHEDNKNFTSKSYADDIYGVADSVHTLFNQELLNREKQNSTARAFDREMFTDVAKLDQAQYRPDALVPADTKGGSRRISEGIYSFTTPELQGTVNLISFIQTTTGQDIGVTDATMGGDQDATKRATTVMSEQNAVSKRMLLRSSSYSEAMSEIGRLFFQGCKDHLPATRAIKLLGADGAGFDEITRAELDLYADPDVRIISSSIQMANNMAKKKARMDMLNSIALIPDEMAQINPRWRAEEKLRSIGEYDDAQIKVAMDMKNYGNKEEVGRAYEAIQEVLEGQTPSKFYGATTLFMQIIVDYASDNRSQIGKCFDTLMEFAQVHGEIARANMMRKAATDAANAAAAAPAAAAPAKPAAPTLAAAPGASTPNPVQQTVPTLTPAV